MFKPITNTNKILKSKSFLQDEVAFNIVTKLTKQTTKYPAMKIFSDEENYIILNTDSNHQVIIWTKEWFSNFDKIHNFIKIEFRNNNPLIILSKLVFYDFLKDRGVLNDNNFTNLWSYICHKENLKNIEYFGYADNIQENEIHKVAELKALFYKDTWLKKDVIIEEYLPEAQDFLNSPLHKVWRNPSGQIVSVANIDLMENYAKISTVITDTNQRWKSYAKMLVHYFSKYIFSIKKLPVMYTDFDYEPSNKCYTAIWFQLISKLKSYQIKK